MFLPRFLLLVGLFALLGCQREKLSDEALKNCVDLVHDYAYLRDRLDGQGVSDLFTETGSFSIGSGDKQGHTTVRREFKNFYHFLKGGNDSLNNIRRETMFINILEGLHPLEAEILVLVKDGRLEDKYNISKEIVSTAYPDIIWGDA